MASFRHSDAETRRRRDAAISAEFLWGGARVCRTETRHTSGFACSRFLNWRVSGFRHANWAAWRSVKASKSGLGSFERTVAEIVVTSLLVAAVTVTAPGDFGG